MYGYHDMNGYDGGWGIGMMFFTFLIAVLVITLVLHFFRGHQSVDANNNSHKSVPLDIVKERYAKGEINKEEFEQIKKDLK